MLPYVLAIPVKKTAARRWRDTQNCLDMLADQPPPKRGTLHHIQVAQNIGLGARWP